MAIVDVRGLSFSYAGFAACALPPTTLLVEEGAFCVVVGSTGSGKTTLLRSLKPELMPQGVYGGSASADGIAVVCDGMPVEGIDVRESAARIGFVGQDPDAQIVCDTVWHELAFAFENLGEDPDVMRRRIAEVAHFFGIESWMNTSTESLSGGSKQLVNLAAVLALRPRVILLDEPMAQLDPNARRRFASLLARVNRELGVTVVMTTHAPEEVKGIATQTASLSPLEPCAPCSAIADLMASQKRRFEERFDAARALSFDDVYTRYDRQDPWVLRGADLEVARGSVHAVVGGNGSGKTTLVRVAAGVPPKVARGRVRNAFRGSQALLPQDPRALFVCDDVFEELMEWSGRCAYGEDEVRAAIERYGLARCEGRHPYDLSGGQQQMLALAKLLLCKPDLLMLDEPTKGLDPAFCAQVHDVLRAAADRGVTVVLVTHDLDFAYATADVVSMVFDGQVVCTEAVADFFENNLIYRANDSSRLFGALS